MEEFAYDLTVIGAGPGGYVAAIRASQLGMRTAVIEKDQLGGVCLNWGCIPSKSLIHQAELFSSLPSLQSMGVAVDSTAFDYATVHKNSRKAATRLSKGVAYLLKKNKITVIQGTAVLEDDHTIVVNQSQELKSKYILIATGSSPRELPGFTFDEKKILSSTGALNLQSLPRRIAILGAGAIGVEFSYIFSSFGVEVFLIEMLDHILALEDRETAAVIQKALKKQSVSIFTESKAVSFIAKESDMMLTLATPAGNKEIGVDKVLVAVGRVPNISGIGLEKAGIETERGFIKTGDYYMTNKESIYAIGDVINTPQLAHVASREGEIAVEHMAGHSPQPRIDPYTIPSAVYSEPQIASFGLNEQTAQRQNIPYEKAVFPYRGAGKAVAVEKPEGIVKVIYAPQTRQILGAHIAGSNATELIHEILLAKNAQLPTQAISDTIHAHPSLAEAVMEAANLAEGKAIHI